MKAKTKKQRKSLIVTLAVILAAVMLPLGAGAVGKAIPGISKAIEARKEEKQQDPEPEIQTVAQETPQSEYMATCLLTGDLLTADGLSEFILSIDEIPVTVDGEEVILPVKKGEDNYPVCYLLECEDSAGDTVVSSLHLTKEDDLADILDSIDTEYFYFLAVEPDLDAVTKSDEAAAIDDGSTAPVLTRDIQLATLHMNEGMIKSNNGLRDIVKDYDTAETVINGDTVYIPLLKDEDGELLWELNESEDGTPDTYIRTVGTVGSDGNETGWAEALAKIKDGYMYYLSAALDFDNAYTLDNEGNQVHYDLAY